MNFVAQHPEVVRRPAAEVLLVVPRHEMILGEKAIGRGDDHAVTADPLQFLEEGAAVLFGEVLDDI